MHAAEAQNVETQNGRNQPYCYAMPDVRHHASLKHQVCCWRRPLLRRLVTVVLFGRLVSHCVCSGQWLAVLVLIHTTYFHLQLHFRR